MRNHVNKPDEHTGLQRQRKRARSIWRFSSSEVTVMLCFAVVAVWTTIVAVVSFRQPVLGGDFMQFFTFGAAARAGNWALQYDWPAFHALQVSLIPASEPMVYAPTYPPLVPALFIPFSLVPLPVSYGIWIVVFAAAYCGLMVVAATSTKRFLARHVVLAGLLFPPFVAHMVIGQSTIWPLMGFVLGWWALKSSRPVVAGVAFSLVAIKPHLGMALALVLLAMRVWWTVSGILIGVTLQGTLSLVVCGLQTVMAYVDKTLLVLQDTTLIEPVDERFSHALRMGLESQMSHAIATAVWLVASAGFGWITISVWRRHKAWELRMSALLLATLLISPHVQAYDAILLAPAALWLVDWATSTNQPLVTGGVLVLAVTLVIPSPKLWGIPITLPLMTWLLWRCQNRLVPNDGAGTGPEFGQGMMAGHLR